jgi:MFS family permease
MLTDAQPAFDKLREQFARFPRSLWLLSGANFVLFCGRGMTVPFLIIYFGQIQGFGTGFVGAGIAASSIIGVAFTLLAAGTIDRFGARTMLIVTIAGTALMTALFSVALTPLLFFVVVVLRGMFNQLYWPSSDTLATSMVPLSQAGEMFALVRVASALGFGSGGLIGGLIVVGGAQTQYDILFMSAAIGMAIAGLLVFLFVHAPQSAGEASQPSNSTNTNSGSWREVFRDRRFMYSQVVMFILLIGLTQLEVSAPPYLRAEAHIDEAWIGSLFTINTIVVVLAQLWVARKIAGWGRGATLAVAGLFWAIAYAMIGASIWSTLLPFGAAVVYTIGEMVFMPTSGVITVELAPEHLRGRYLAFGSVIWGSSYGLAAWMGGAILSTSHPGALWPAVIAVVALGAAGGLFYDRFTALPVNAQRVGIAESD